MKILLHICCAPCSIFPINSLRSDNHDVTGFFYNPNIHPFQEYKKRMLTLKDYAEEENIPLLIRDDYNFEDYIRKVAFNETNRCYFCYEMRLRETAERAKEKGFEAFSTTLLVSPYQKHELIKEIGYKLSNELKIPFLYKDYRNGFREATAISRERGMYRQPYCGCIYSEKERYFKGGILLA